MDARMGLACPRLRAVIGYLTEVEYHWKGGKGQQQALKISPALSPPVLTFHSVQKKRSGEKSTNQAIGGFTEKAGALQLREDSEEALLWALSRWD